LPVITRELSTIARVAPDLAAEIYISVFTYREPSDETTNMSKSQILSLTSNRRQDYDMAKWTLAEFYPTFILQHPVLATTAMLGVIDAYRILEHASEAPPEVFRVNDQELTLVHDYSQMWDDGAASQIHTELKILNAFFRHLESLAQSSSDETTLDTVLNTLLRDARPAVIWSRLLRLGANILRTLAPRYGHSLAFRVSCGHLTLRVLLLISSPRSFPFSSLKNASSWRCDSFCASRRSEWAKRRAEHARTQLILSLETHLTSCAAKELLNRLKEENAIREPRRSGPSFHVTSRAVDETVFVEEFLGVSTKTEPHQRFLGIQRPVKEFCLRANAVPNASDVEEILPHMQALLAEVKKSPQM